MSRWETDKSLTELFALYLEDASCRLDPETKGLFALHAGTHLVPFYLTPERITTERMADYTRARLKVVLRTTLQKERSTFNGFLDWCVEQKILFEPPAVPKIPKGAKGTKFGKRRRGKATQLTPADCRRLIGSLPEWSTTRGGKVPWPIRPRFVVMYETALRPATLDLLSHPEHYCKGQATLTIEDEMDKARFGREVPLTAAARAALDGVIRAGSGHGLIFGEHDYRYYLDKAAKETLTAQQARTFTAYDLRHARITELAETGNLPGLAHIAGHKQTTTTSMYIKPGLRAAERTLAAAGAAAGLVLAGCSPTSQALRLVGEGNAQVIQYSAKERTRTSTGVTPLAPQASARHEAAAFMRVREEAAALLRAAALDTHVEASRLHSLARAALELSDLGRLALGVLDGGTFASARALELARFIVAAADAADERERSGG